MSEIEKKTVTVITVVFNAFDSIEKTILSVINQTYLNIEYIIVDGGSTDGTLDIIKKYGDKITRWISEPDKGIYDAMNKGVKLATGRWINFMNAGDVFYSHDTISKLSFLFGEKHNIIYGTTNMVMNFGSYVSKCKQRTASNPMPFIHQSSFCRIELLLQFPFDISFKYAADYNFFYSIYHYSKVFIYNDILSSYSLDGISTQNAIEVNCERIRSNPCWRNYCEHMLCYRNFFIKKVFKILHVNAYVLKKIRLKRF